MIVVEKLPTADERCAVLLACADLYDEIATFMDGVTKRTFADYDSKRDTPDIDALMMKHRRALDVRNDYTSAARENREDAALYATLQAQCERQRVAEWQPIESAPKSENAPILVWFDHHADPYHDPNSPTRLTDYAAVAEGGDFLGGKGVAMVIWRDGYHESDDGQAEYWIPGGWFLWVNWEAGDQVVNATHWMPLPAAPASLDQEGQDA